MHLTLLLLLLRCMTPLAPASRVVVIKGPPASVQRAAAMVKDLISGEPGTASQIIAKVSIAFELARWGVRWLQCFVSVRLVYGLCILIALRETGYSTSVRFSHFPGARGWQSPAGVCFSTWRHFADFTCAALPPSSASLCTLLPEQHGVGSTLTLQCPRGIVGRVIGKGGETIKGLQRKYHVSIQIDQGGDPMAVTITGPKHTSEACKQEVMALISDPMGPPFGDMGELHFLDVVLFGWCIGRGHVQDV